MSGLRMNGRELPPLMQEQAAVKIAGRMAQRPDGEMDSRPEIATPVCALARNDTNLGKCVGKNQKVSYRRLVFPCRDDALRWKELRRAAAAGIIAELRPVEYDGRIVCMTYRIRWVPGMEAPEGVDQTDLMWWSTKEWNELIREETWRFRNVD